MQLTGINHIAIICSDIDKSIDFYVNKLGFSILHKTYREKRDSWKVDLTLQGSYLIELFSFPNSPQRPSYPEALGLRHLAFSVDNLDEAIKVLNSKNIQTEEIRTDSITGNRCVFLHDPDCLPIELVE